MAQRKIAKRAGHETGRSAREDITMAIKKEKLSSDQAESRRLETEYSNNCILIIPKIKKNTRVLSYSVIFCNDFCNVKSNLLTNKKPLPKSQIEGMGDLKGRN